MGSGTTAKMAIVNNRKYIGSEISEDYCKIIETRIKECGGLFFNFFQTEQERSSLRITVCSLAKWLCVCRL